jgi:Tfp pilus assembly protein PilF
MATKSPERSGLKIGFLAILVFSATAAIGQVAGPAQTHLGKVNFPTSCSAEAQPRLEKGLALLHSFQYTEAHQTWEEAETRDPKCAMAHWGKAMSLYEQLGDFPNEK